MTVDQEVNQFLRAIAVRGVLLDRYIELRAALSDEAASRLAAMHVIPPREPALVVDLTEPDGR